MTDEAIMSFDEFRDGVISDVQFEISDTEESSKIVFLKNMLEYLDGITSMWGEDPDYYHDNRIQATHHSENWEYLDVILSEYRGNNTVITGYTSIKQIENRFSEGSRMINLAFQGKYTELEESNELRDFSKGLYEHQSEIKTIRYYLISDFPCIPVNIPAENKGKYKVEYHVWDLRSIYKLYYSLHSSVITDIDLKRDFNDSIPCIGVKFDNENVEYDSYIGFMKGSLLADLYEKYNERLLEGNIRVFLQTKVSVNKGIRSSLRNSIEKNRFFAYNNGISATAAAVVVSDPDKDGYRWIEHISGLQIVNGGQTTASIHNARKEGIHIDGVYVQMKLTVPKKADDLRTLNPKIAEYSNSQNQIKKADFTSNNPYHLTLEKMSREVKIPGHDACWFYERIRGQYDEAKRLDKKKNLPSFETRYPKSRKLTKTDIALYVNTWNQYPYFAANGGEKNFVKFTALLKNANDEIAIVPDSRYYRELIAMSILFKRTNALVGEFQKTSNYGTGHKRQIVLYTLSLLSYLTEGRLSLEKVWLSQSNSSLTSASIKLSQDLENYITSLVKIAEFHINNPPSTRSDKNEWAKYEGCWTSLKDSKKLKDTPVPESVINCCYLSPKDMIERDEWMTSIQNKAQLEEETTDISTSSETEITQDDEIRSVSQIETDVAPIRKNNIEYPADVKKFITRSGNIEYARFLQALIYAGVLDNKKLFSLNRLKTLKEKNQFCEMSLINECCLIIDSLIKMNTSESIPEEPDNTPDRNEEVIFNYITKGSYGKMAIREQNYVVLAGSTIVRKEVPSIPTFVSKKREDCIKKGVLIRDLHNPELYLLQNDVNFDTSGQAASFVSANNSSGLACWKYNNITLKEYLRNNQ